jgi:hypothetical protein
MSHDNPDAPQPLSDLDMALARELAAVRARRQLLYDKLNGSLKALFSYSEWRITRHDNGMSELVVICPNIAVYKRLRNKADTIHSRFQDTVQFKHTRFILSYPPSPDAFYEHEINSRRNWSDRFFPDDDDYGF